MTMRVLRLAAPAAAAILGISKALSTGLSAQEAPDGYEVGRALPPSDPGRETIALTLEQAIERALETNLDIQTARLSPRMQSYSLQAARAAGCRVMTGRDLAIDQAVDAFRLFTGFEPSRERIGAAFDAVIAKRGEPK